MIIDAEYEELDDADGELDLSDEDSLPWLEADEDEDDDSGDNTQIIVLGLILLGILIAAVGAVWYLSNRAGGDAEVADGSVIEAPEGPIKERPEDPGGKEFAGTGNVAPVVGEGGTRDGVINTDGVGGEGSGDANGATGGSDAGSTNEGSAGTNGSESAGSDNSASSSGSGVGVQLAAYSSRARAEQGWREISRRTDALTGLRFRIEEGVVDIGKVYRLQAVSSDRAAANRLCAKLKSDGIDCQVKG